MQLIGQATRYLHGLREPGDTAGPVTTSDARRPPRLELLLPFNWPESDSSVQWCICSGSEITEQGSAQNPEDIAAEHKTLPVFVWLAAGDSLLTRADIPPISTSKLVKAVPYAMEDRVLGDIDNQFFIWHRRKGQPLDVCVVAHDRMKAVIAGLKERGLEPHSITPVVLSAAMLDNCWTLVCNGPEAWLRTGELSGLGCTLNGNEPPYALVTLLAKARKNEQAPSGILLINAPESVDAKQWAAALDVQIVIPEGGIWENMDRRQTPLGLLQGPYAFKSSSQMTLRKLLPAAIMATLLVLGNLGIGTWQWWQLRSEASRLHHQMVQLFKQTFPKQASTVIDPALQMQRNLDLLRQEKGGARHNDFLTLLGPVSQALASGQGNNVSTLGYRDGRLSLSLRLENYQALDSLKARLSGQHLQVEIAEANSDTTGVTTVLKISSTTGGAQ